jgi:hypothetical protein
MNVCKQKIQYWQKEQAKKERITELELQKNYGK